MLAQQNATQTRQIITNMSQLQSRHSDLNLQPKDKQLILPKRQNSYIHQMSKGFVETKQNEGGIQLLKLDPSKFKPQDIQKVIFRKPAKQTTNQHSSFSILAQKAPAAPLRPSLTTIQTIVTRPSAKRKLQKQTMNYFQKSEANQHNTPGEKKKMSSLRHNLAQMMKTNSFSKQKATSKYNFECDVDMPLSNRRPVINLPREPIRCNSHGRELLKINALSQTSMARGSKQLLLMSNTKSDQKHDKTIVADNNYFSFNKPLPGENFPQMRSLLLLSQGSEDSTSPRAEEIVVSDDESDQQRVPMITRNIGSAKKTKFMPDSSLDIQIKPEQRISVISHQRLETQLIEQMPIKSPNVKHFKNKSKIMSKQEVQSLNRQSQEFNQNKLLLSKFNCLHGNKLSLRLQNIKLLQPSHFYQKQNITHLDLRNNRLKTLPDSICELILLREMKVDYNFLIKLPYGLHRLQHLQYLSLSQNLLKKLPKSMFRDQSNLQYLIINDNKLKCVPNQIGKCTKIKSLLLHNNPIYDLPVTFYKFKELHELGLDWMMYLHADNKENQRDNEFKCRSKILSQQTKILKGLEKGKKEEEKCQIEYQNIINHFIGMFSVFKLLNAFYHLEEVRLTRMSNPQQDDDEEIGENGPEVNNKAISHISFVHFLMYFNCVTSIEKMIVKKTFFSNKQRKLSHLLALYGHEYLLNGLIRQVTEYQGCESAQHKFSASLTGQLNMLYGINGSSQSVLYQLINAVDKDFSTPLILAIKNKRYSIVKILINHPKTCFKQSSMKFGSALHVALQNENMKNSLRILKLVKKQANFNPTLDLNKVDEDGNTPLHLVFKNFSSDVEKSISIATWLIKLGAFLEYKNKAQFTPLSYACYYSQNEAVRFALDHNSKQRKLQTTKALPLFDFNQQGGKLQFSPLHQAVFQNNYTLIALILQSEEFIDLDQQDQDGRIAVELCNSISSVFKLIRKSWKAQRHQQILKIPKQSDRQRFQEIEHNCLNFRNKKIKKTIEKSFTKQRERSVEPNVIKSPQIIKEKIVLRRKRSMDAMNSPKETSETRFVSINQLIETQQRLMSPDRSNRSYSHLNERKTQNNFFLVPDRFKKTLITRANSGRNSALANEKSEWSSEYTHVPFHIKKEKKLISSRVNLAPIKQNAHVIKRVPSRLTIESSHSDATNDELQAFNSQSQDRNSINDSQSFMSVISKIHQIDLEEKKANREDNSYLVTEGKQRSPSISSGVHEEQQRHKSSKSSGNNESICSEYSEDTLQGLNIYQSTQELVMDIMVKLQIDRSLTNYIKLADSIIQNFNGKVVYPALSDVLFTSSPGSKRFNSGLKNQTPNKIIASFVPNQPHPKSSSSDNSNCNFEFSDFEGIEDNIDNVECLKNNHNSTIKMQALKDITKAKDAISGEFDLSKMLTVKHDEQTFKLIDEINYKQSLLEITQKLNIPKLNLATGSQHSLTRNASKDEQRQLTEQMVKTIESEYNKKTKYKQINDEDFHSNHSFVENENSIGKPMITSRNFPPVQQEESKSPETVQHRMSLIETEQVHPILMLVQKEQKLTNSERKTIQRFIDDTHGNIFNPSYKPTHLLQIIDKLQKKQNKSNFDERLLLELQQANNLLNILKRNQPPSAEKNKGIKINNFNLHLKATKVSRKVKIRISKEKHDLI